MRKEQARPFGFDSDASLLLIGGLITPWLRVATVILGMQPTAQYI